MQVFCAKMDMVERKMIMRRSWVREIMVRRSVVNILVWVLIAFLLLFLAMAVVALLCGDDFILTLVSDIKASIGNSAK